MFAAIIYVNVPDEVFLLHYFSHRARQDSALRSVANVDGPYLKSDLKETFN